MEPKEQKPPESSVANSKVLDAATLIATGVRKRVPMSTAVRKMETPAIDGYYLYWFREINVPRAIDAGYEFVNRDEVHLQQVGLANDKSIPGNTDLGSRVSLIGSVDGGPAGGPERAYLMKLRQEWRDEDKAVMDARNAAILSSIFKEEKIYSGKESESREIGNLEYKRATGNLPLFNRPTRKAKIVR